MSEAKKKHKKPEAYQTALAKWPRHYAAELLEIDNPKERERMFYETVPKELQALVYEHLYTAESMKRYGAKK